jgi:hypothetical protein
VGGSTHVAAGGEQQLVVFDFGAAAQEGEAHARFGVGDLQPEYVAIEGEGGVEVSRFSTEIPTCASWLMRGTCPDGP